MSVLKGHARRVLCALAYDGTARLILAAGRKAFEYRSPVQASEDGISVSRELVRRLEKDGLLELDAGQTNLRRLVGKITEKGRAAANDGST